MRSASHPAGLRRLDTRALTGLDPERQLVDAHGAPYFAASHIPGAVNLPPHEVRRLAPRELRDKAIPIVVYGAPGSSNAAVVAEQLVELGYRDVSLYEDGLEGWIAAGLPVEGDPGDGGD
ncbi:MAG TPA: rhodanese-like domain-containing protein [Nocardioidaceae bacterium]|nr:rhodanese-like domain-containing protein [Nocardioidaceae bacterium]